MIFGGAKFIKHQVLYIKKNLRHSAITTLKDIKIGQPGPEKRGVSKEPRTLNHPVVSALIANHHTSAEGILGLMQLKASPHLAL